MFKKLLFKYWQIVKSKLAPNPEPPVRLVTTITTEVVDVTKYTTRGNIVNRQEILMNMCDDDQLFLQRYDDNGTNAIRVVLKRNFADIGNLDAELAEEICRKYSDHTLKITNWELTYDENCYGCSIKIEVYK